MERGLSSNGVVLQGLDIDIRAMAAAGAERVSNGGCGPHDTLHLTGSPAEDGPRLEEFLSRFHAAGLFALNSCPALTL